MAVPFDPNSYSNQTPNAINAQFHQFNSNNLGLNDRTMNQQNHAMFSSHQTVPCIGQLGLTQRLVNEVRTSTSLVPQRVQLVQTVNIDFFPVQNQTPLPGSSTFGDHHEFCVTEVVRTQEVVQTQLLNSASTRDRFLAPNHDRYGAWSSTSIQGQANLQNQVMNHPIYTSTCTETQSSHNPVHNFGHGATYHGSKSSIRTHFENPMFEQQNSSYQYVPNPGFNQNPPTRNQTATLRLIEIDEPTVDDVEPLNAILPGGGTKKPIPTQNQVLPSDNDNNHELQSLPFNVEQMYNTGHHDGNTILEEGDDHNKDGDEIEGDGRTHSLPYKKYGPYTCPKCKGVFMTSQLFAAHMGSHYKYESAEQRRRRHLAKYGRKKHLRLVNSKGVLTVVPDQPQPPREAPPAPTPARAENKIISTEVVDEKQERGLEIVPVGSQLEGLYDVPNKEESLE